MDNRAETTTNDHRTRYYKGVLFLILSSFSFAVMNVSVRMAGDLPTYEKVFFRNLIAFFFAVIVLARKRDAMPMHWDKERAFYMFLRCAIGCVGVVANFYAIDHMVVADAAMLNKLSPFFILIFSIFMLGERVKPFQLFCIILAFIGVLFIVKPGLVGMQLAPALIGILSGMNAGFAYTCVRKLGLLGVPGPWIVLCFSAFSCLAMQILFPSPENRSPFCCWQVLAPQAGSLPSQPLIPMRRQGRSRSMITRSSYSSHC